MENKKFYQLTPAQRLDTLQLKPATRQILEKMTLEKTLANHLIENQISEIEIPLGLAQNFVINGKKYVVPMATEEPSVIAAASNGAKMAGAFKTMIISRLMHGQIVFYDVKNPSHILDTIVKNKTAIFDQAEVAYPSIVKRGGGLRDVSSRILPEKFISVDFKVDVKDAMGANIVNSILEGVASLLQTWFPDEKILFSILSNLATESMVRATCEIPLTALSKSNQGKQIAKKITIASHYSKIDPYRAATHNKGIMNGIDAVLLATGNDTRAVAACLHAFASLDGQYRGLGTWWLKADKLMGEIELPLPVATVGGAIKVLPKVQAALEMLQLTQAEELAQVIAAVGLAQNLAALRALVSEGIQQGHMSLQIQSLAMTVGAKENEIEQLSQLLRREKVINQERAYELLAEIRQRKEKISKK